MLPVNVGIVSQTKRMSWSVLTDIAGALQKQVTRDFSPIWKRPAIVSAFHDKVPHGYYPIYVQDDIGEPGAAGYHSDENGLPFALVDYNGDAETAVTLSHELLEMLADKFGRTFAAGDWKHGHKTVRVLYLVEVADPCEAVSYPVNGVLLSDFVTPAYFDPDGTEGKHYSMTGKVKRHHQVLPGGYLSWYVPETKTWWQETWFDGPHSVAAPLEGFKVERGVPAREAIDSYVAMRKAELKCGGS